MCNHVPRAFHVHPLFGEKGNGNEVQIVKFLLQVETTKNPRILPINSSFISQTLNVKFIFKTDENWGIWFNGRDAKLGPLLRPHGTWIMFIQV